MYDRAFMLREGEGRIHVGSGMRYGWTGGHSGSGLLLQSTSATVDLTFGNSGDVSDDSGICEVDGGPPFGWQGTRARPFVLVCCVQVPGLLLLVRFFLHKEVSYCSC